VNTGSEGFSGRRALAKHPVWRRKLAPQYAAHPGKDSLYGFGRLGTLIVIGEGKLDGLAEPGQRHALTVGTFMVHQDDLGSGRVAPHAHRRHIRRGRGGVDPNVQELDTSFASKAR
jgi:hypothetical protein